MHICRFSLCNTALVGVLWFASPKSKIVAIYEVDVRQAVVVGKADTVCVDELLRSTRFPVGHVGPARGFASVESLDSQYAEA